MSRLLTYGILQQKRNIINNTLMVLSFRKINPDYTGYCIKVRRSSDDATQDIGFSGIGLDTSSLLTFVGVNNGYIDTWYDQSGNSNNASQSTTTAQPQIVSSGNVIVTNELPALTYKSNGSDFLSFTNALTTIRSVFLVCIPFSFTDNETFLLGSSSFFDFHGTTNSGYFSVNYASTYVKNGSFYRNRNSISPTITPKSIGLQLLSLFTTGNVRASNLSKDRPSTVRGYAGDGVIQEVIIYSSDKSSSLESIQSNIINYYKIKYPTDLKVTFADAAYVYSLRNLGETDYGNCIKVRRSSDDRTKDIGFYNGVIDEEELLDFVGEGDGFVYIWYDQSSNQNHLYQLDNGSQPQIVSSGSVIKTNGKPAFTYASDGNDYLKLYATISNIRSVFWVVNPYSALLTTLLGEGRNSFDLHGAWAATGYFDTTYASTYVKSGSFYRNGSSISPTTTAKINSQQLLSLFTTGNVRASNLSKDRNVSARGYAGDGVVQELIIYTSDKSANRETIESNINSFYSIY